MEKTTFSTATLEEVNWKEARSVFEKIKPELAELIDERKLNKQFTLIRARYPYGSIILQDGLLYLPNKEGKIVPINHPSIDEIIRNRLSYSNFPLGLMTHNAIEVSRQIAGRVFTLRFFLPGIIMGLWESLDPPQSHFPRQTWTVTAGARFIFTLPKIQAATNYARLRKEFDLPYQAPKEISQQWDMFRQIANHPNFGQPWYQELYFFPKEWLESDRKDMDWIKFHHFLLQEAWRISEHARNTKSQDVVWDLFANILSTKGHKPNPIHIDILRHLISMALGDIPGIRAAGKSQIAAPTEGFQEVLIDSYGLKQYVPTIMHPYHFSMDDSDKSSLYYSYHVPNLLTALPPLKSPNSTINELLHLHDLMEQFLHEAASGHLKIENTFIAKMIEKVKFTYFHSDATGSYKSKILNSQEMPTDDKTLVYLNGKYGEREFSDSSHFVRGCVRISKK